jgi:hypothetical protein
LQYFLKRVKGEFDFTNPPSKWSKKSGYGSVMIIVVIAVTSFDNDHGLRLGVIMMAVMIMVDRRHNNHFGVIVMMVVVVIIADDQFVSQRDARTGYKQTAQQNLE